VSTGLTGATGPMGSTGATGPQGPVGPGMDVEFESASQKDALLIPTASPATATDGCEEGFRVTDCDCALSAPTGYLWKVDASDTTCTCGAFNAGSTELTLTATSLCMKVGPK
jgi:hypothetical protein